MGTYDSGKHQTNDYLGRANRHCDLSEASTFYPVRYPSCAKAKGYSPAGAAIVLIHSIERREGQTSYQPDRVTFCEWWIHKVVSQNNARNRHQFIWSTQNSIYGLRNEARRYATGNGAFDINEWRRARNYVTTDFSNVPDIDASLGFETFLTNVVCQSFLEVLDIQKTLTLLPL